MNNQTRSFSSQSLYNEKDVKSTPAANLFSKVLNKQKIPKFQSPTDTETKENNNTENKPSQPERKEEDNTVQEPQDVNKVYANFTSSGTRSNYLQYKNDETFLLKNIEDGMKLKSREDIFKELTNVYAEQLKEDKQEYLDVQRSKLIEKNQYPGAFLEGRAIGKVPNYKENVLNNGAVDKILDNELSTEQTNSFDYVKRIQKMLNPVQIKSNPPTMKSDKLNESVNELLDRFAKINQYKESRRASLEKSEAYKNDSAFGIKQEIKHRMKDFKENEELSSEHEDDELSDENLQRKTLEEMQEINNLLEQYKEEYYRRMILRDDSVDEIENEVDEKVNNYAEKLDGDSFSKIYLETKNENKKLREMFSKQFKGIGFTFDDAIEKPLGLNYKSSTYEEIIQRAIKSGKPLKEVAEDIKNWEKYTIENDSYNNESSIKNIENQLDTAPNDTSILYEYLLKDPEGSIGDKIQVLTGLRKFKDILKVYHSNLYSSEDFNINAAMISKNMQERLNEIVNEFGNDSFEYQRQLQQIQIFTDLVKKEKKRLILENTDADRRKNRVKPLSPSFIMKFLYEEVLKVPNPFFDRKFDDDKLHRAQELTKNLPRYTLPLYTENKEIVKDLIEHDIFERIREPIQETIEIKQSNIQESIGYKSGRRRRDPMSFRLVKDEVVYRSIIDGNPENAFGIITTALEALDKTTDEERIDIKVNDLSHYLTKMEQRKRKHRLNKRRHWTKVLQNTLGAYMFLRKHNRGFLTH